MKMLFLKIKIALCLISSLGYSQSNQNGFSATLNDEWRKGNKMAVKNIAEERLSKNPNDLASQLIIFEYALEYFDVVELNKLIPVLRKNANKVKTQNFEKQKMILNESFDVIDKLLPTITEEMRLSEVHKGDINGKQLMILPVIQALEMDSLVSPLDASEKNKLAIHFDKSGAENYKHTPVDSGHSLKTGLAKSETDAINSFSQKKIDKGTDFNSHAIALPFFIVLVVLRGF